MHFNCIRREKCFFISAKVVCDHKKCYYCIGNLLNMADESASLESFIAGLYKIMCLWRVNMQPTLSSRTCVLNPLLPSTSTLDALLHLICCTHLCFLQKKESPPFFLAQERICVCFVQDELALFVIILNFHAMCQNSLCFVINGQSEWTQPFAIHERDG